MSSQTAQGTGIAQAQGQGAVATVNIAGLTSEQVLEMALAITWQESAGWAKVEALSLELKTTKEAVTAFLKTVTASEIPFENWPQTLAAIAQRHRELLDRLSALSSDDPRVQGLRREALTFIKQGQFETADEKLSEAENVDLKAIEEQEALIDRRRSSAAETRAARGDAARLRLDYRTAAAHFAEAASLVIRIDADNWRFRVMQASALCDQGVEFGDNAALHEAIAVYGQALRLAPRERVPLDWAMTQNNLGAALSTLGERESGTARLEEAVSAYDAALEVFTEAGTEQYIQVCQANKNRVAKLLREKLHQL